MENRYFVIDTNDTRLRDLSRALTRRGIYDGSDRYYTDDKTDVPYFKIPKSYLKESPDDIDVEYIYIDVSPEEYTVCGRYVHEHIDSVDTVVSLVDGLMRGEVVEMALVYPHQMAGFFMRHTGDHETNVSSLGRDTSVLDYIMQALASPLLNAGRGHTHTIFPFSAPYYLMCDHDRHRTFEGVEIYVISSIIGVHPEYYVIK